MFNIRIVADCVALSCQDTSELERNWGIYPISVSHLKILVCAHLYLPPKLEYSAIDFSILSFQK